jgi:hypothetical protein
MPRTRRTCPGTFGVALAPTASAATSRSAFTAAAPASASSYVDKKVGGCSTRVGCAYGIVVRYWYKTGSHSRGVSWVDATKETMSNRKFYARWTYKEPGGRTHVGKGWKRARDYGSFQEVDWSAGTHRGPKFPKSTKICVQWKGYSTKLCKKLT